MCLNHLKHVLKYVIEYLDKNHFELNPISDSYRQWGKKIELLCIPTCPLLNN